MLHWPTSEVNSNSIDRPSINNKIGYNNNDVLDICSNFKNRLLEDINFDNKIYFLIF